MCWASIVTPPLIKDKARPILVVVLRAKLPKKEGWSVGEKLKIKVEFIKL